jgi:hypothetical protein
LDNFVIRPLAAKQVVITLIKVEPVCKFLQLLSNEIILLVVVDIISYIPHIIHPKTNKKIPHIEKLVWLFLGVKVTGDHPA